MGVTLTGSVRITIAGLSADAENGGTVTITALGVPNFTPRTIPLPTSGDTGNVPGIPAGSYLVSYLPPLGYALAPGETNPKNAQVRAGEQTTVSWEVVAAEGTVRVTVIGLDFDAPDGGSATLLRTDILEQLPVTLPIPVGGTAYLDVLAGTYSVTYTPPGNYTIATGISNPQEVTAVHGGVGEAKFAVTAETFETPDTLDNASFESGWDGFTSGSGGTPNGSVIRSTDRAFDGSVSLKFPWTAGGGEVSSQVYFAIGSVSHFWTRAYFYFTAIPNNGGFKFIRYADASFNFIGGVQLKPFTDELAWINTGADISALGASIETDAWHYLEYEWDVPNKELRFWLDGVQIRGSGLVGELSWLGSTLHYTSTIRPGQLEVVRVINGPPINSGAVYIDRVAVSTKGRIGP